MPNIAIKLNSKGNYEININNDLIILTFEEIILLNEKLNQEINS